MERLLQRLEDPQVRDRLILYIGRAMVIGGAIMTTVLVLGTIYLK